MYKLYSEYVTRTSPFIWSHRLEIPIVVGLLGWIIALVLGSSIDIPALDDYADYKYNNTNSLIFFMIEFVMILVTLTWLAVVSKTLPLANSIKASKYPVLTIIALGVIFLNAPSYIFSNLAVLSYDPSRQGWPLIYSGSGQPWDRMGLAVGLGTASIVTSLAVLVRKTNLQNSILSLFVSLAVFFLGVMLVVAMNGRESEALVIYGCIAGVLIVGNALVYSGRLFRFHDLLSGASLFCFSLAMVFLVYIWLGRTNLHIWEQLLCFCLSLVLSEIIVFVIRGKKYIAT